jgi:hypothetical protein
VVTSTDEKGQYTLELGPGEWSVSVRMFGFEEASRTVQDGSTVEWVLQFSKPATDAVKPTAGFAVVEMSVVSPDPEPEPVSAPEPPADMPEEQSFLVSGSVSRGLAAPKEEDLGYMAGLMAAEQHPAMPGSTPRPAWAVPANNRRASARPESRSSRPAPADVPRRCSRS